MLLLTLAEGINNLFLAVLPAFVFILLCAFGFYKYETYIQNKKNKK